MYKVWFTVVFHYLTRSSDVLNGVVSGGCLFDNLQMYCDVSLKKSSWSTTSGRQATSWASQKSTKSWGIVSPSLPQSTLRTVKQAPMAQINIALIKLQLVWKALHHTGHVFNYLQWLAHPGLPGLFLAISLKILSSSKPLSWANQDSWSSSWKGRRKTVEKETDSMNSGWIGWGQE